MDLMSYSSLCVVCSNRISHQVVVGEPCDLLLDAVLHLSLRRQRRCVVQYLLLLLDVVSQQLNLSVKGFKFIFVLPGLSLQLSLQQPERTMIIMLFLAYSPKKISLIYGYLNGLNRCSQYVAVFWRKCATNMFCVVLTSSF